MSNLLKQYNELIQNGYTKVRLNKKPLIELRKDFTNTFSQLSKKISNKKIANDKDIIQLYKSKHRKVWTSVYDLLKFNKRLYALSSSNDIDKITKIGKIKYPYFSTKPYVRVDMPNDPNYRFHTHQDYPFNKGSLNSLVIWIPLQSTDISEGCLMVAPKSHKKKTIFKTDKHLIIQDDNKFKFVHIPCKLGECLVFSQYLVHRSGHNTSDSIRFSVQLRVNDLCCNDYASRYFFVNKAN